MSIKYEFRMGTKNRRKANDLSGSEWVKFSISLWDDIAKTTEEKKFKHPAMFPSLLIERIVRCLTQGKGNQILDPFMGSGSTLVAAKRTENHGVGFEINADYIALAKTRLSQGELFGSDAEAHTIYHRDAHELASVLEPASIDLCVTSPPYWDILLQKRTADYKETRNYGELDNDISHIRDYELFVDTLADMFRGVLKVLKDGCYCVVNVMDLRKGPRFFPFHSDLASRLVDVGFVYDDLIVWDRRKEYNNLRALGYPYVFRLNKVHEFLLIFRKPVST